MQDRDILMKAIEEAGGTPSEDELIRLDGELTQLAEALVDHFIEQRHQRWTNITSDSPNHK
jgi:hypothetical protein